MEDPVRDRRLLTAFVLACGVLGIAAGGRAQSTTVDQYFGTYAGTWDGSGTGTFELTLAKGADGAAGGKVSVTTDGGNYDAELKAIAFDGGKMTAKYDFPLDPSAEVVVAATFDGGTAKGTWSLHAKGQTDEIAGGTWTVTKK
jgi:hypothetical protein